MAPDPISPRPRTSPAGRQHRCAGPRPEQVPDTVPAQGISALRFTQCLLHLSRARIELHAAGLKARRNSPDDDVAWWEATLALNRTLRHERTGPQAAMAAHLAAQAVLAAAARTGLGLNPDVAAVAVGEVTQSEADHRTPPRRRPDIRRRRRVPQGASMDTLLTVGLISSLVAAVTAMHLHLTARPLEPAPVRLIDDIDAEFFRIIEHEGLRDAWPVP